MAQTTGSTLDELTPEQVTAQVRKVKMMLMVGAVFVFVGYLLVGAALYFELTVFHPLVADYFANPKAVRDAAAAGSALNGQLAAINQWPSTLLWLKLGGVAHILTGVFVALGAIVRALSTMPDRLGSLLSTTGHDQDHAGHDATPADD
jgi:NAD/NADP transhydrogenase alpha subunit